MQRRVQADENDLLARCEGVRRRETERFRDVSAHKKTFLLDLAGRVGCSDCRWAVPPCAARRTLPAARKSDDFNSKPPPLQPLQPSPPPPPPSAPSKTTPSGTQRSYQLVLADEEGTQLLPVGVPNVAMEAAVERGAAARTPEEEARETEATEPAVLDRARVGTRYEGFGAADVGREGPSSSIRGGDPTTEDRRAVPAGGRSRMDHAAKSGGTLKEEPGMGALKDGPDMDAFREGSGMRPREAELRLFSKEASLPRGKVTTMASAAAFLLARGKVPVEQRELSVRSPALQARVEEEEAMVPGVGAHEPSPVGRGLELSLSERGRVAAGGGVDAGGGVEAGAEGEGRALSGASALGGESRGVSVEDEWRRPVGAARPPSRPPVGLQGSSGTLENAPAALLPGEGGAVSEPSHTIQPKSRKPGKPPEAVLPSHRGHDQSTQGPTGSSRAKHPDAATAEVEEPTASADRRSTLPVISTPARDRSPAATQQSDARQGGTGRDGSDAGGATGGSDVAECESRPGVERQGERRRSEDATENLLREASRVKGLLATMDKADASTGNDGLRHEDPECFLASLGLVELKPLSGKLAEALDRTPQASLGDAAVAVPEPRTARGLRDQVTRARVCHEWFGVCCPSGEGLQIQRE